MEDRPTRTIYPMRIQVAMDYLRIAHGLLDGSACQLESAEVEGANLRVIVRCQTGLDEVHNLAAAHLLSESWFYGQLPITTRVEFVAA